MQSENNPVSFARIVKDEWNAVATITAWRRWHKKTVAHFRSMNQTLMEAAEITSGNKVLDLASGSGEPALTVASLVGPEGRVVATDLSAGMLALAKQNSTGIDNVDFQQADAHDLPFTECHFDVVTCRLGMMYFWDSQRALRETLRVLKPGGRAVFIAWGALEHNGLARTAMLPFAKRKEPPALPPGAPHPLRFAEPGSLAMELKNAGFSSVQEQQKIIPCPWPGPPDELWRQVSEMAVPLQAFFNSFEPDERNAAIREVIAGFENVYDGNNTDPTTCVVVVTGRKEF